MRAKDIYAKAAAEYRPDKIRTLFVAEAPPEQTDRYFYFQDVKTQDALWANLMRALYGAEFGEIETERALKAYWLKRFSRDGFFLIDAVKEPFSLSLSQTQRQALIAHDAVARIREIKKMNPDNVILIKATVYDELAAPFMAAGISVSNVAKIPFPGSGNQKKFREGIAATIRALQP